MTTHEAAGHGGKELHQPQRSEVLQLAAELEPHFPLATLIDRDKLETVLAPALVLATREVEINVPDSWPTVREETDQILEMVAQYYDLNIDDLLSDSRTRHLVGARQMAMYLLRQRTELSLPKIGSLMQRDHTTVVHGIDQVKKKLGLYPALVEDLDNLEQLMGVAFSLQTHRLVLLTPSQLIECEALPIKEDVKSWLNLDEDYGLVPCETQDADALWQDYGALAYHRLIRLQKSADGFA